MWISKKKYEAKEKQWAEESNKVAELIIKLQKSKETIADLQKRLLSFSKFYSIDVVLKNGKIITTYMLTLKDEQEIIEETIKMFLNANKNLTRQDIETVVILEVRNGNL